MLSQVLRAAHRSDLPSFPNQDPSGTFGDPGDPNLRIVAVGDSSITAPGVEALDNVWVRSIAIALAAEGRHVEMLALAIGGSKAHDVIEGQLAEALRLEPDIVLVSVGANDALRGVPPGKYRRRLTYIVDRFTSTGAPVVILGMGDAGSIPRLPPSIRPLCSWRSRVFNQICIDVAVANPLTVKVYTQGTLASAFWADLSLFSGDQFHAGDAGHQLFAREAMPAVRAALAVADGKGPRSSGALRMIAT